MGQLSRTMRNLIWPLAILLLAVPLLGEDTPTSFTGATVVNAEKANSLMKSGATMVDARIITEFIDAHIKGSISIPYRESSTRTVNFDASADTFNLAKLPKDKNAPIIFYCNGPTCWKSYKATVLTVRAGYKHVYWFRDGFPAWKASGLPVE